MWWGHFSWAAFPLPHSPRWRDNVFNPNPPEQGVPGRSVVVTPQQGGMKIDLKGGLSGPTQCYLAVPYLLPAPILDATIAKWAGNHWPRWLLWSSSQSCIMSAFIPSEEWAGADVLWSEESGSTQLCLHLETADLLLSPGKLRGLRSLETVPNKDPGMRHCRPVTAVWTQDLRSYWRLSEIRHTWPKFHGPLYLLTSGYLQCNLFASVQLLANCVVASTVLGLGTCWEGLPLIYSRGSEEPWMLLDDDFRLPWAIQSKRWHHPAKIIWQQEANVPGERADTTNETTADLDSSEEWYTWGCFVTYC